jgi:hypothetical protein
VRASSLVSRRSRFSTVSELRPLALVVDITLFFDFGDRLVRFTLFVELRFLPFTLFDVLFIAILRYSTNKADPSADLSLRSRCNLWILVRGALQYC